MVAKRRKKDFLSKFVPGIISIVLLILWICFIFRNSTETAAVSSRRSQAWVIILKNLFSEGVIRKLAHLFEYTVLGILLRNAYNCFREFLCVNVFKRKDLFISLVSLVSGVCIAAIDEMIQLHSAGRSAQLSDVLLDSSGVFLGIIIFSAVMILVGKIKIPR